jgi:hypothetical protein
MKQLLLHKLHRKTLARINNSLLHQALSKTTLNPEEETRVNRSLLFNSCAYYYMDDTVTGNIVRLLYEMRISPCMDDAMRTELSTSLFVPIGRRYIDLK